MKILLFPKNDILVLIFVLFLASNIRAQTPMVFVQGGTLPSGSLLGAQSVGFFEISQYEVTWGEWKNVRDWAVNNGYTDLVGVGAVSSNPYP